MSEFWQRPTHSVVCSSIRRMRNPIRNLINTQLHKGGAVAAGDDRSGVLHPTPGAAGVNDPGYSRHQGLGGGVGRALGVGSALGVGVALGVDVAVGVAVGVVLGVVVVAGVAVAVGVTVAVDVGVGLAVGVGVGVPPPEGDTRT